MYVYVYLCISVCVLEVAELFNEASGSGDGDLDFFLPAVHQRGKLLILNFHLN